MDEKHFDNYINEELNKLFRNQFFLDEFCLPELKLGTLCFRNSLSHTVGNNILHNKMLILHHYQRKKVYCKNFDTN